MALVKRSACQIRRGRKEGEESVFFRWGLIFLRVEDWITGELSLCFLLFFFPSSSTNTLELSTCAYFIMKEFERGFQSIFEKSEILSACFTTGKRFAAFLALFFPGNLWK